MRLFIALLNIIICALIVHSAKIRRYSHIDRFEECNKTENVPQELYDIHWVNHERENAVISFKVVRKWDQRHDPRLEVVVTRCANREALDTCEHFTTLKPLSFCQLTAMPNTPWFALLNNAQPPLKCPYKKGKYITPEVSIDPELFTVFSLDNYYWKIKMIFIEREIITQYYTICWDFKIIKIRSA